MSNSKITYIQVLQNQLVLFQRTLLFCGLFCTPFIALSQVEDSIPTPTKISPLLNNSIQGDSSKKDSIQLSLVSAKSALDEIVEYEAQDSIILDMKVKKAYLFGNAWITFEDIKLEADHIIIDFDKKDVFARGVMNDSTGKYAGRPKFTDKGKVYEADTMKYNFQSKKGLSMGVLTTEKDGYIHGEKVLRDSLENIYVKNARFTTCNLPEPHFYIRADKIKVIPRKQIVTGPANLVISEIRTPLFVPFGFFPIPENKAKGLIFPTFGESPDRGFFFRGLGYYVPIKDVADLKVTGDFYFRGSWGMSASSSYYKRYKYRGNIGFAYNQNRIGEPESPNYRVSNDINVTWNYAKDSKAKPGSSFSADVKFVTSSYLKNNTSDYNDIIRNNSNSSINYSKSLFKNKLNLGLNSNIYQDLAKKDVNLTLPQFTANLTRQLPFKNANIGNKTLQSFVRKLGVSYTGNFKNEVKVKESTFLSPQVLDSFNNAIRHSIPIGTSFKAFKWVTVNPSFNYTEYWYFETLRKAYDIANDSLITYNNINGFERAQEFSLAFDLTTRIYGTKQFKTGFLRAFRHVMTPSIGASWNPDFSKGIENGYIEIPRDSAGNKQTYSIYEAGILGRPGRGPQGSINFNLINNLEAKIFTKKDTTNKGIKKIKLIEQVRIGGNYNFLADSLKLSTFNITGNTRLFNRVSINFNSTFDPYVYDSVDNREFKIDKYLWKEQKKLGRFNFFKVDMAFNLNPKVFKKKDSDKVDQDELEFINSNLGDYIDFNIPWSFNINYSFQATRPYYNETVLRQTLKFDGDVSLTPNWKIGASSGYDFVEKSLAFTSLNFFRDLHCWEFSFKWYPIERQMFEFAIRAKSSTLQDLKLNRKRSWWDL